VLLKRGHNVVLRVDRQSVLNLSYLFLSVSLQFNHSLNLTLPLILSLLHLLPCVFEFQSLFNLVFLESNYITRSSFESKIPLNVYYSLATQLSFHRKSPEKKDGGFFVGRQFIEAFCEFNCDEVDQGESEKKGNAYQDSSIEGLGDNIAIANGDKRSQHTPKGGYRLVELAKGACLRVLKGLTSFKEVQKDTKEYHY